MDLQGKTVVVTGASAGVGEAAARLFAKQKANLILIARNKKNLDRVVNSLRSETKVVGYAMDVLDTEAFIQMLKECELEFGAVHVLVNNAGYHKRGDVVKNSPQDLAKMVDVNLRAPIELSAHFIPYVKRAGQGAIVNVGSLAGRTPLRGAAAYSATKAGLRAFTYALAEELVDVDINVGVVSPGPISTGFILSEIDEVEDIVFSQPMSTPEQVANAIISIAKGERIEISMTWLNGVLTTVSYLFPRLRIALRPTLYKIGRKKKEKYRSSFTPSSSNFSS